MLHPPIVPIFYSPNFAVNDSNTRVMVVSGNAAIIIDGSMLTIYFSRQLEEVTNLVCFSIFNWQLFTKATCTVFVQHTQ